MCDRKLMSNVESNYDQMLFDALHELTTIKSDEALKFIFSIIKIADKRRAICKLPPIREITQNRRPTKISIQIDSSHRN